MSLHAERLASALKTVLEQKGYIDAVVSALEKAAPTSRERQDSSKSLWTSLSRMIVVLYLSWY